MIVYTVYICTHAVADIVTIITMYNVTFLPGLTQPSNLPVWTDICIHDLHAMYICTYIHKLPGAYAPQCGSSPDGEELPVDP